ncbi:DUF1365 domain-containing protein [Kiritimatiellaeota bacterium B1221]|nr:DUF1365 domain-containing protein [Kiritimatiellaeota bacterium B1221]
MHSRIYSGKVVHARLHPVRHDFSTGVGFVELDLSELTRIDQHVSGFGINRFSPVSFHESQYLAPGDAPLLQKLAPWIEKLELSEAPARISLVTSPDWWGKSFNPVSFYLLRNAREGLIGMIAEVNNTFGDRHIYPVQLEQKEGIVQGEHQKEFHVSPFNDMEGSYQFTVREDGDSLYIGVNLYKQGERFLDAWIEGTGEELTTKSLYRHYLRHPLRPWLTLPKIVWQALFLKFQHKLNVFKRPDPKHPHSLLDRHHPRA